jgi:hypothetical protein
MTEEQLELREIEQPTEDSIEDQAERLLAEVFSENLLTIDQRVAWILNFYPEARNSDITLQLRYWEEFEEDYDPSNLVPEDLYRFARLTSLARARANIQNKLKLFLADEKVRKQRGTLDEEEREIQSKIAGYPIYSIYADESGKTQTVLIVGSYWILEGRANRQISKRLQEWKDKQDGAPSEFHFQNVSNNNLPLYKSFVDQIIDASGTASFKYVKVPRTGLSNQDAIRELFCHLLIHGVTHEHESARAPLPRNLQLFKDADEEGADHLLFGNLRERLENVSASRFDNKLVVDLLRRVESQSNILIQVADLFTASVNRIVNSDKTGPKGSLAQYFIDSLSFSLETATAGDMTFEIFL